MQNTNISIILQNKSFQFLTIHPRSITSITSSIIKSHQQSHLKKTIELTPLPESINKNHSSTWMQKACSCERKRERERDDFQTSETRRNSRYNEAARSHFDQFSRNLFFPGTTGSATTISRFCTRSSSFHLDFAHLRQLQNPLEIHRHPLPVRKRAHTVRIVWN